MAIFMEFPRTGYTLLFMLPCLGYLFWIQSPNAIYWTLFTSSTARQNGSNLVSISLFEKEGHAISREDARLHIVLNMLDDNAISNYCNDNYL